ncbi:MAG TPA: hypothetical protein IAB58_05245 [Candidatus Pelethosoma merdigallinarum]|nr:hypothetical protein [Candidatus Pelethosoma merdigallinarum]
MKTIEQYLIKKIRQMEGVVITIGCSDSLLEEIDKNSKITLCNALNNTSRVSGKYQAKGRMRRINIKKFKKKFKKKKTDTMIIEAHDVLAYAKRIVPISVYLTKKDVYIYTHEKEEKIEEMIQKYDRFRVKTEVINKEDGVIYKMDCRGCQVKKLQEIKYLWKDTIDNILDLIGDYLIH